MGFRALRILWDGLHVSCLCAWASGFTGDGLDGLRGALQVARPQAFDGLEVAEAAAAKEKVKLGNVAAMLRKRKQQRPGSPSHTGGWPKWQWRVSLRSQ
eukprot:scaffold242323_cov22-Tisochrysis_lutea.AAC.3